MQLLLNKTILDSTVDGATQQTLLAANTTGVDQNNRANMAMSAGDFELSVRLHREALALKIRAYSETSVQAWARRASAPAALTTPTTP
jgi:hypothetical protein